MHVPSDSNQQKKSSHRGEDEKWGLLLNEIIYKIISWAIGFSKTLIIIAIVDT